VVVERLEESELAGIRDQRDRPLLLLVGDAEELEKGQAVPQ
jgi:hypothetical protein